LSVGETSALDEKWREFKRQAHEKYTELKRTDPAKAEEYLKGFPKQEDDFLKTLFREADSKFEPEVEKIRKQFGLELIYHPDSDFDEDDFLTSPIFQDTTAVSYETRTIEDNDGVLEISTVWDSHFIKLKIDIGINRKKEQILSEVEEFIESSRIDAGILNPGEKEPDKRLRIDEDTFKVWDLYIQGKRPTDIIKTLWPEEYDIEAVGDDSSRQEEYYRLLKQYERAKDPDAVSKAYHEAYEIGSSGKVGLYVRVGDKLRRMKKLLEEFGPISAGARS